MLRVFVILAFWLVNSAAAHSATFEKVRLTLPEPQSEFAIRLECGMWMRDEILEGDLARLQSLGPIDGLLCLDSPGGSLNAAMEIGEHLREALIGTYIPAGAECLSACAVVFMAGTYFAHEAGPGPLRFLSVDGRLAIHAPALDLAVPTDVMLSAQDALAAYDAALAGIARMMNMFEAREAGYTVPWFQSSMLAAMLRTPNSTFEEVDTPHEVQRWNIPVVDVAGHMEVRSITDVGLIAGAIDHVGLARACENISLWRRDMSERTQGASNMLLVAGDYYDDVDEFSWFIEDDGISELGCKVSTTKTGSPVLVFEALYESVDDRTGFEASIGGGSFLTADTFLPPATEIKKVAEIARQSVQTGTLRRYCYVRFEATIRTVSKCSVMMHAGQVGADRPNVTSRAVWDKGGETVFVQPFGQMQNPHLTHQASNPNRTAKLNGVPAWGELRRLAAGGMEWCMRQKGQMVEFCVSDTPP